MREELTGKTELYLRCYALWTTLPTDGKHHCIMQLRDENNTGIARLRLYNDGGTYKLQIRNGISTTVYSSSGISLSTETFYHFEMRVVKGDGDGVLEAWFEGSKEVTQGSQDTDDGADYGECNFGIRYSSEAHTVYIDSCVIADAYVGPIAAGGDYGGGAASTIAGLLAMI